MRLTSLSTKITSKQHDALRKLSAETRIPMGVHVREALDRYLFGAKQLRESARVPAVNPGAPT